MSPASPPRIDHVLITCEHGGHNIPSAYRRLFRGRERLLDSHRGWDPGSLQLARLLARHLDAPLIASTTSRLLVDLNRSVSSPSLFSKFSAALSSEERVRVLAEHYGPYRASVEREVRRMMRQKRRRGGVVLHLSVHTFTPVFRGEVRETDIGVLFDPSRELEALFCGVWLRELRAGASPLRRPLVVRANDPYKGTDDGLTTHLRGMLPADRYLGVELEVCQRFPRRGGASWGRVQRHVAASLERALNQERAVDRPVAARG